MLATVVVTALLVARRAPRRRVALNLLVWVAAVLVTTPLFVRLSGLHASIDVSGEGDEYEGWGSIGLVGWQATLLLTLVALLVALIVAWRAGGLDVTRSARRLATSANASRATPAVAAAARPGAGSAARAAVGRRAVPAACPGAWRLDPAVRAPMRPVRAAPSSTSRWVTSRTVLGPTAATRTPASAARATNPAR